MGAVGSGASTSVSIALAQSVYAAVADICEWSGLGSNPVDQTATNNGTGSTQTDTGTTATTTQANELFIGTVGVYGQAQSNPTNSFTMLDGAYLNVTGGISVSYLYKIVSSTGTANSGTTIATSSNAWQGCIATFKASSAGTASKLAYTAGASQSVNAGSVSSVVTVQVQDVNSNPVTTGATVSLSTSSSGGSFYSDSGGNTQITSIVISSGQSSGNFYYKDTTAGTPTLTVSSTGLTSATTQFTINASGSQYISSIASGAPFTVSSGALSLNVSSPMQVSNSSLATPQANNTTNGYLASSDWTTFNNKYGSGSNATFAGLTTAGNATIGGDTTVDGNLTIDGISILKNDVGCYGFFGSSSDLTKGTGGGAILMGHGFTSPTDNPQFDLTDTVGNGSGAAANLTVNSNGTITAINVTSQGSNYYFADADIQQPTNGSGARLAPVINGPIQSISIVNGGSKYSSSDTVTIIGGNGGAHATLTVNSNGTITAVNVTSQGDNYSLTQTGVDVTSSTGAGAQLLAVINGKIKSVSVYSGGAGYSASDTVSITNTPHNTLYLKQTANAQGATSPANLDLGNLTVHGNLTVEGQSNIGANLPLQIISGVLSILQASGTQNGYLSSDNWNTFNGKISPYTNPTLSGLTVTNGGAIAPVNDNQSFIGTSTNMWQNMFTRNLIIGNNTAQQSVSMGIDSSGLILNFNTTSSTGGIVPDYGNQGTTKTMALGSSTNRWHDVYCANLTAYNLSSGSVSQSMVLNSPFNFNGQAISGLSLPWSSITGAPAFVTSGSSPTFTQLTIGTAGIAIGSGSIYWQTSTSPTVLESDNPWIFGNSVQVGNGLSVTGPIGATGNITASALISNVNGIGYYSYNGGGGNGNNGGIALDAYGNIAFQGGSTSNSWNIFTNTWKKRIPGT